MSSCSPSQKTIAWNKAIDSPAVKTEIKNVFLGSTPTKSYNNVSSKLSKELKKASIGSPKRKKSNLSPKRRSGSPKRTSGFPKRTSGSPKRTSGSPKKTSGSHKKTSGSPKRKSGSPKRKSGSPRRNRSSLSPKRR